MTRLMKMTGLMSIVATLMACLGIPKIEPMRALGAYPKSSATPSISASAIRETRTPRLRAPSG